MGVPHLLGLECKSFTDFSLGLKIFLVEDDGWMDAPHFLNRFGGIERLISLKLSLLESKILLGLGDFFPTTQERNSKPKINFDEENEQRETENND